MFDSDDSFVKLDRAKRAFWFQVAIFVFVGIVAIIALAMAAFVFHRVTLTVFLGASAFIFLGLGAIVFRTWYYSAPEYEEAAEAAFEEIQETIRNDLRDSKAKNQEKLKSLKTGEDDNS